MNLFLCSFLSKCRKFDKEEIDNKKVAFIPQLRCVTIPPVMSARLESYSINWEQPSNEIDISTGLI